MSPPAIPVPSDEDLARRAQQGCAASFELLIRRFQTPVLHFLRHRGLGADAEDVLQETFVRAYTRLDQYRSQWRFATWLFTIARRLSVNHRRRHCVACDRQPLDAIPNTALEPRQAMADAEDRQALWTLAARILSEEEQTALWLYYVEEMPTREIAAVLERSTAAVKTMLHRARKKLQAQLDGTSQAATRITVLSERKAPSAALDVEVSHG